MKKESKRENERDEMTKINFFESYGGVHKPTDDYVEPQNPNKIDELDILFEKYFEKYDEPQELYDLDMALGYAGAVKFMKRSKGKKITYIKPDDRVADDYGQYIF